MAVRDRVFGYVGGRPIIVGCCLFVSKRCRVEVVEVAVLVVEWWRRRDRCRMMVEGEVVGEGESGCGYG